jgi:hypothetical protein
MDQNEFFRFLQEIIKNSGEEGMSLALIQFANILERNNFDQELVDRVTELSNLEREAIELKKYCFDADLDKATLEEAVERGRLRKKREEEDRRGRC